MEFLTRLFDPSGFPARWQCGAGWAETPWLGWLHIFSDLGVWTAYVAIPLVLAYFLFRRRDLPFRKIFLLFGAFILACGTSHLMEAILFWWPAYRLAGIIKLFTAVISWITVFALVPIVPAALALRSPKELEREIAARRRAELGLTLSNAELEVRIEDRTVELARANRALHEEREQFRMTLSCIGEAVIATDAAGRVNFLNPVAQLLTGWNLENAMGIPLVDVCRIVDEQTRHPVQKSFDDTIQATAIDSVTKPTVLIAKDGTERPVEERTAPIKDSAGTIVGAVVVFRDISERRQQENARRNQDLAIRQSERHQRLLADTSRALVSSLNHRSILREIAELTIPALGDFCLFDLVAGEQLDRVGWKHVDPTKNELSKRVQMFIPSIESEHDPISRALRSGRPECNSEVTDDWLQTISINHNHLACLRDLNIRSIVAVPMLIGQRRLGALTFVYCDSDRRHTSEEIRLAEEIGHRTALTVENAKLYNQLQESDRRKDEFLATLAHELRNPLAPIRNGLQILELAGDQRETLDDVRQMMVRQIGQMVRLVDDLLDISRISRGKIELHLQRLEVKAVIQLALETSRPLIDEAQHTLTISMPAQALYVTADLTRLAQVVSNLLNNSAKYTPEGGHIWLTVQEEEDQLAIRVRDNGIGIPSVNLPEIFGMFTQLGRASTRVAGGLGIGLALVQRLVQMHGGSVEATSSGEGQGSEFIVRLMIANDSSAAGAAEEQDHSTQIATPRIRRILVVDDNKDSAETLGMMLRLTGNVVVVANDGPSALAQASVFRPHIVLLDIGLPGITGYDVARQLREMPYMRNALLIAQTGWGQDVDRRLSAEAGFNHHLVKPIEPKILEELLAEFKTEDESTRRGA